MRWNPVRKVDVILNQDGSLIQEFKNYLYERLSPEFIPNDYKYGYYIDFKLLGKYHNSFKDYDPKTNTWPIKPESLTFEQWVSSKRMILRWMRWVTVNIFDPNAMITNTHETDRVNLRIAVSQLNNWNLPDDFKEYIFDNLILHYYVRKRVFNNYYFTEILKIPFY